MSKDRAERRRQQRQTAKAGNNQNSTEAAQLSLTEVLAQINHVVSTFQARRSLADQIAYKKQTSDDAKRLCKVIQSWDERELNEDVIAGLAAAVVYARAAIRMMPDQASAAALTGWVTSFSAVVVELAGRVVKREQ